MLQTLVLGVDAMKKGSEVDLRAYVKVELLGTVMLPTPSRPLYYSPTLMFRDDAGRALAIPIDNVKYTLVKEALEGDQSSHGFFSETLRVLGHRVEGAFIYGLVGTEMEELRFLSKITLRNMESGGVKEVEGTVDDILSTALVNNVPIYVKKDVMSNASTRLPQGFNET